MSKRSHEPIFWSLFGAGGVVGAMFLPVIIFITVIGVPLGVLPPEVMSYERMHGFVAHPIGKLIVFLIVSLTLWHAAHRIHHGSHDIGIHQSGLMKLLSYGGALIGTALCGYYVLAVAA